MFNDWLQGSTMCFGGKSNLAQNPSRDDVKKNTNSVKKTHKAWRVNKNGSFLIEYTWFIRIAHSLFISQNCVHRTQYSTTYI